MSGSFPSSHRSPELRPAYSWPKDYLESQKKKVALCLSLPHRSSSRLPNRLPFLATTYRILPIPLDHLTNRSRRPGQIGTARVAIQVRVLRIVAISSATTSLLDPEFSSLLSPFGFSYHPKRIFEYDGRDRPLCLAVLLLKGDNLQFFFSWPAACSAPTIFGPDFWSHATTFLTLDWREEKSPKKA